MGFRRKSTEKMKIVEPKKYPSGTCVRTPSGIWYLKGGKKFRVLSERVLSSWNFPRVVDTSDIAISKYPYAGKLGLREGTYFIDTRSAQRFLVSENKKRQIVNPDWFELLGLDPATPLWVSADEADLHLAGEVLE